MDPERSTRPFAIAAPPYYVAGKNKAVSELAAVGRAKRDHLVETPFAADVRAAKGASIYRLHPYHTKVPPAGIEEFIRHYTAPGEVVLDPFCGSGMTGVAALSLGRRAVLVDLSPMATFIAYNTCRPLEADALEAAGKAVLDSLAQTRQRLYRTHCRFCADPTEIEFILWTDTYRCQLCGGESSFWQSATDETGKGRRAFPCPHCGKELNRLRTTKTGTRPEVFAYRCTRCGGRKMSDWDKHEGARLPQIEQALAHSKLWYPKDSIPAKLATRRTYWKHITRVDEFFEARELLALAELYEAIRQVKDNELRLRLLFLFTAILPHASRMNRYKPAGIRSGVIYIPAIRKAVNPFLDFQTRLRQYRQLAPRFESNGRFAVSCQSACELDRIPGNSIDYVFTDPPFGGNLQYSELNLLWEAWLGHLTDKGEEAVINRHQGKGVNDYGELMRRAFAEAHRVLRPGRWMTLVFHNSSDEVWHAIQEGLLAAGFAIASVRTFDKRVGTYNQVVGEGACGFDVTVNCRKPLVARRRWKGRIEGAVAAPASRAEIIDCTRSALREAKSDEDRSARMLYSRLIGYCMERGRKVPCSFAEFRKLLAGEFEARDGLWYGRSAPDGHDRG